MNKEFEFHKLNAAGIEKAKSIAEGFDLLLEGLKKICPECRELSICKTKLEGLASSLRRQWPVRRIIRNEWVRHHLFYWRAGLW